MGGQGIPGNILKTIGRPRNITEQAGGTKKKESLCSAFKKVLDLKKNLLVTVKPLIGFFVLFSHENSVCFYFILCHGCYLDLEFF